MKGTTEMNIKVTIKSVYGTELVYPACEVSQAIVLMKGTKTLSRHDIHLMKKLNWNVEVKAQEL